MISIPSWTTPYSFPKAFSALEKLDLNKSMSQVMRSFLQGTTRIHFLQFRISGISDEIAAEVSLKLKVTKLEELVSSL